MLYTNMQPVFGVTIDRADFYQVWTKAILGWFNIEAYLVLLK